MNQLPARVRADLAHVLPVAGQTSAAADALATVLPGEAFRRFDETERHLLDAHIGPVDVEFLGDHHWDRGAQPLADLRVLAADDDFAVRVYLHEKADLALARFFPGKRR